MFLETTTLSRNEQYAIKIFNNDFSTSNVYSVISTYKTKYNKSLSSTFKRLLLMIARKYNKTIHIDAQAANQTSVDDQLLGLLPKLILYYLDMFQILTKTVDQDIAIALLLVLATNLRSSELDQLSTNHLRDMLQQKPISIRIKKKLLSTTIIANNTLLEPFLPRIWIIRPTGKLILTSISTINKHIRKWLTRHGYSAPSSDRIGLIMIRKFNTSLLYQHLKAPLVSTFNRHTTSTSTGHHYNIHKYTHELNNFFGSGGIKVSDSLDTLIFKNKIKALTRVVFNSRRQGVASNALQNISTLFAQSTAISLIHLPGRLLELSSTSMVFASRLFEIETVNPLEHLFTTLWLGTFPDTTT